MQYNRNFDFTSGQVIVADQVDLELNTVASVLNGNIDTDNLANGSVTVEKMSSGSNPETRFVETGDDFVYSGLTLDPASGWTNLVASITAGVSYVSGRRVSTVTQSNHTFTASKDTYIDMDYNGTFYMSGANEVALGAAAPALQSGRIRIALVKTDATKITAVLTGRIVAGAQSELGTIIARPIKITAANEAKFCAWLNDYTPGSATSVLQYNNEKWDTTNSYSTSTYKFVAPVSGFYHFDMSSRFDSSVATTAELFVRKNGTTWNGMTVYYYTGASMQDLMYSTDFYLPAGEYVEPCVWLSTGSRTYGRGSFSGHFIGQ